MLVQIQSAELFFSGMAEKRRVEDGLRELPFQAAGLIIYEYSNNQSQAVIEFKGPFPLLFFRSGVTQW